jgi:hypothetical protein
VELFGIIQIVPVAIVHADILVVFPWVERIVRLFFKNLERSCALRWWDRTIEALLSQSGKRLQRLVFSDMPMFDLREKLSQVERNVGFVFCAD